MAHRLLIIVTLLLQHFHRALCGILAPATITPPPPRPTNVDLRRHAELDRRDTVYPATCGYTSRDVNYPKTCPIGLGCGWYDGSHDPEDHIVVCVPVDQSGEYNWQAAPLATTCLNYGERNLSATAAYSETYSSTLFCGVSSQTCATVFFEGGPTESLYPFSTSLGAVTFTSMFCTDSITQVRVYQAATNSLSSSSSSSSPAKNTHTDHFSANPGPTRHSTPTATSDKSGGGSSSNTGVIAGATVGGVVGLVAIGAIVGFLVWRKKHEHKYAPPEISREVSEVGYPLNQGSVRSSNSARWEQGGYPQGGYAQGGYPQAGYPQEGYGQGGYANGGYANGGYANGAYAQGGYGQGGYPQGSGYAPGLERSPYQQ